MHNTQNIPIQITPTRMITPQPQALLTPTTTTSIPTIQAPPRKRRAAKRTPFSNLRKSPSSLGTPHVIIGGQKKFTKKAVLSACICA